MGAWYPGVSPYTPYKGPRGLSVIAFCRRDLFLGCLSRPSEQRLPGACPYPGVWSSRLQGEELKGKRGLY
ncbi:hypothetical protein QQF64_004786 [Cirrhinus molitorella]|uniref:Uncharacterized protein n=1 Tax=Cirrhinus molitorella TaxID=172907 RepID=A0ABR3MJD3_9TELE